jgi:hypothetical protein
LLLTLYAIRPGAAGACLPELVDLARGLSYAWPEFLLELELLPNALKSTPALNTTGTPALFQLQASAASSNNTKTLLFPAHAATARSWFIYRIHGHLFVFIQKIRQSSGNLGQIS